MSDLQYHRAECEQKKDSYIEFDSLDFNINVGEGRVLVKNSVRLCADLRILDNGARSAVEINFDPKCGAHAFIDSATTQFLDGPMSGQKENVQNYSRYVAMQESCTKTPEDSLNASMVVELKADDEATTVLYSKGRVTRNSGTKITQDQDFAMKPVCMLNKMSGGHLPYSKSGVIRLSLNLSPNRASLMGLVYNQAQDSYELRNPRLLYQSLPDVGNNQQTIMRTIYNIKNTIQSNFANIQARVPAIAEAVSVSFQRQDREQSVPFSNYLLNQPCGIEEIQFLFNDSTNEYISYKIDDKTEMLQRFINSFKDTGHNTISGDRFNANNTFGLGMSFGGFIDLSTQKFALQVRSKINNTQPYNCYMYFHGLMAV